jgi:hypothetical protein
MEWDCAASSHESFQQLKQQPNGDDFESMCDFLIDNLETGPPSSCSTSTASCQRQAAQFPAAIDDEKLLSMLVDFRTDDYDNCFESSLADGGRPEAVDAQELTKLALGSGVFGGAFDAGLETFGFPLATDDSHPPSAAGRDTGVHSNAIDGSSATVDHDYCTRPTMSSAHEALTADAVTGKSETTSVSGCCDSAASRRSSASSQLLSSSSMRCDSLRQLLLDTNLADEVRRQTEIDREASRLKMSTRTSAADAASEFISRLWKMTLARELQQQLQQQQQAPDFTATSRRCTSAEVQSLSSARSNSFSASPDVNASSSNRGTINSASASQNSAPNDLNVDVWPSLRSPTDEHIQTLAESSLSYFHTTFSTMPSPEEPDDASVEDIGGEETITTTTLMSTLEDKNSGIEKFDFELDDLTTLLNRPETLSSPPSCGAVASTILSTTVTCWR